MCYDKEYQIRRQLKNAIHNDDPEEVILDLKRDLWILTGDPYYNPNDKLDDDIDLWPGLDEFDYYHINGFKHPPIVIIDSISPRSYKIAEWGFIPSWVKTVQDAYDFKSPYNNNLNAQSGTMFEKRGFKKSAKYGRCVISIDAYYEHHDYKGKKYPFRIFRKDEKPMYIGAIHRKAYLIDEESGEEVNMNVVATLTCEANPLLAKIHNNPAMVKRTGHRMLVILEEDQIEAFLKPYPESEDPTEEKLFQEEILSLCQPYDENKLDYHTVRNLHKRKDLDYLGNIEEIKEEYQWEDLDYSQF